MSSDFLAFEEPFYTHHRPNSIPMFNSEALLLSDPFSALSDSSIDSLLQISEEPPNAAIATTEIQNNNLTEAQSFEELAHMESLSLYQQAQFAHLQSSADFPNGFVVDSPVSGIKLEETRFPLGFDSPPIPNAYFSRIGSYGGESSMIKYMQRSYSHGSHLYDEQEQGNLFQPAFSALSESTENSLSNGQFGGQMRRVLSTGDLPMKTTQTASPSNLGSKSSTNSTTFMEEASFKVAKYSAEERKERIDRYRAKRSQRNFNKTIKYSCRKTLADSRPRIRGRFARNDEPVVRAKSVACFNPYEDEDDHLWVEGLHERIVHGGGGGDQRGGHFMNNFGASSQFDHEFIGY